jgi:predicted DNA-binding transcriptional regulator YafY
VNQLNQLLQILAAKKALGREKDKLAATELKAVRQNRMKPTNTILMDAINDRRRLAFDYNGKSRVVEPQCYGVGTKGTELLRAHQLVGGTQAEPLFDVSKIQNLKMLDERFSEPGPHYTRNDSAMSIIFAQL